MVSMSIRLGHFARVSAVSSAMADDEAGKEGAIRLRKGFLRRTSCYGGQVGASLLRGDATKAELRAPYTFLRNEPILLSITFRWIRSIHRDLHGLQRRLQRGSFGKNKPILGVF